MKMQAKELVSKKTRVPNRWLIATMCTLLQLCLGTVYAWSYFQPLLVEQFRWTNTETSWAFSLTICCDYLPSGYVPSAAKDASAASFYA